MKKNTSSNKVEYWVWAVELFMGGFGRITDRIIPKKSTHGLKHSKAHFLSLLAHF